MVSIKLFSVHELAVSYFKSFGITEDKTLEKLADDFLKKLPPTDDADRVFAALDDKAYAAAVSILGPSKLTKEEFIGYFKMLCLSVDLKGINVFEKLTDAKLKSLQKQFSLLNFTAAPQASKSKMEAQKIKVYKPLLPLKKRIKHLFKRKGQHVRK